MEPSRNRIVVPARQATKAGRIDYMESILGLLKSLKILALTVLLELVTYKVHLTAADYKQFF